MYDPTHRPFVIAINGPPKIGKTWLSHEIQNRLDFPTPILSISREILREYFDTLCIRFPDDDEFPFWYKEYKDKIQGNGKTGRQAILDYELARRSIDSEYWAKKVTNSPPFRNTHAMAVIFDGLGHVNEMAHVYNESAAFMPIVIAPKQFNPGDQFPGDLRVCLDAFGGFRVFDSDTALSTFEERLKNALPYKSNGKENRSLWFRALMG